MSVGPGITARPVAVRLLTTELRGAYEAFLAGQNDAWPTYSLGYQTLLHKLLGCESRYLVATRGDAVTGIMPVMAMEGDAGTVLNSLPFFGSPGGVLTRCGESARKLLREYAAMAEHCASSVIIPHPLVPVDYSSLGCNLSDVRISQVTSLLPNQSEEEVWMSFDGSVRRNVRKAEQKGITVAVENDMFPFLRSVHEENMAAIGGKPKPPRFFDFVPRLLQENSDFRLYVARHRREPVAALLLLLSDRVAEYFVPVTRTEARPLQPLAMIIYRAMCDLRGAGVSFWNWGGTWTSQEGVYRFKRKWAASEVRYDYHINLNNRALLSMSSGELARSYPNFYTVPFSALQTRG